MFNSSCNTSHRSRGRHMGKSSGNAAFDAYKAETLHRLREEQDNFEAFLKRLRDAKDKAEFDQFMNDRADANAASDDSDAGQEPPRPAQA